MFRSLLTFRPHHVHKRVVRTPLPATVRHKTSHADKEQQEARDWLSKLNTQTIPRNLAQVTFSRSSGPGGQHVNTTNSKATLKLPLEKIDELMPKIIYDQLRRSTYYAKNSHSLIIQTDTSRSQKDNLEGCWRKLQRVVEEAADGVVKGETSPEQRARVQQLQKAEREHRLKSKKFHSSKKAARQGRPSD